jgi:hypothetical protein
MLVTYNIEPNHRAMVKRLAEHNGMNASAYLRFVIERLYREMQSQADTGQLFSALANPWQDR